MGSARPTHKGHYLTIVVGCGPAGIMAAFAASRRGPVLLIDSSLLPRDKSCGGMINEYAQRFLAHHGGLPESMICSPRFVNFRYFDWDRHIRKATGLRFVNVDRVRFDDWLLSLLPDTVEVRGGCMLTALAQHADGVEIELTTDGAVTSLTCDTLVGADGARSTVRRALGKGSAATYVTLQDFCLLESEIESYFDCIYMRDLGDFYAYSYLVPKGEHAIFGSVFYPRTKRPYLKQDQALETLRKSYPQLGASVKREAGVALAVRNASDVIPGSGRTLLAGEAGGFMSPTSGEGISYALNSGWLAGEAIALHGSGDALEAYARAVLPIRKNLERKLKWLPLMESSWGKYLAGFIPTPIVSKITEGL